MGNDEFRFPPYQYKLENLVAPGRPLNAEERETFLGFPRGHTCPCLSRKSRGTSKRAFEDQRVSLCAESVSCHVLAWLFANLLFELNLIPNPPGSDVGLTGIHETAGIIDSDQDLQARRSRGL